MTNFIFNLILVLGTSNAHVGSESFEVMAGLLNANQVINSQCFKSEMLKSVLSNTRGMDNVHVYNFIMETPAIPVHLDIFDGSFWRNYVSHTIAWEDQNEVPLTIHVNRHFGINRKDFGATVLHEYMHELGFIHKSSRDSKSVPYTAQRIYYTCLGDI